jgi:ribosome biogenesis GTPase
MPAMPNSPEALARLRAIGWPDEPALQAAAGEAPVARVIGQHRSAYVVAAGPEQEWRVQPPVQWTRPRFDPELRAAVGDWVTLDADSKNIVAILPRYALLKRAAAGEHYKTQLIAANIDHVLVVCGLDRDFNPRRIERYLLVVQASGAAPVLVLTKADECEIVDDVLATLDEVRATGTPIHPVNAKDAESLRVLHPYLGPGRTVVLVGSSGAGKSTLTNTLLGVEKMKTKTVRENDQRGRHTTTHRALIPLPQGGCIIDTPGMRELKLSGEETLADGAFEDIDALIGRCRYSDCGHSNEPGCAVLAALESGELDDARYAHYVKLRDERDAAALSLAVRRAEVKEAHKGFHKRLKDKYGRR